MQNFFRVCLKEHANKLVLSLTETIQHQGVSNNTGAISYLSLASIFNNPYVKYSSAYKDFYIQNLLCMLLCLPLNTQNGCSIEWQGSNQPGHDDFLISKSLCCQLESMMNTLIKNPCFFSPDIARIFHKF